MVTITVRVRVRGQLGDGTKDDRKVFVQVRVLSLGV